MTALDALHQQINERFAQWISHATVAFDELTVVVKAAHLHELCLTLRDDPHFDFKLLIDVCGVDYLQYGLDDWPTESTTETGFGRGVLAKPIDAMHQSPRDCFVAKNAPRNDNTGAASDAGVIASTRSVRGDPEHAVPRFAVVYHLLSLTHRHRIRLRVMLQNDAPLEVRSVMDIWSAADWFEREAFDLFGILFQGHPDLRRLLTDYGFHGHPFRKDFPLIGKVEARYDATLKRVIYEPVSIEPRILEPKVIRRDSRYLKEETP